MVLQNLKIAIRVAEQEPLFTLTAVATMRWDWVRPLRFSVLPTRAVAASSIQGS